MGVNYTEIRVSGKTVKVPSTRIDNRTVVVQGKWLRIAAIQDEELVEGEIVAHPQSFLPILERSDLTADLFTFKQNIYDSVPKHNYPFDWDNVAVVSTASFVDWWEKLPQETRKNVRRAARRGVSVRVTKFDDELVRCIKNIYDETPTKQGRRFWHYGKNFETVKMEAGTYLERSEFIGAYYKGELIGAIKFVYVDRVAWIMQILSQRSHFDKRPMNALIAKAMEVCHDKGMLYLVYAKFSYGNKKNSPLAEFKLRNGFEEMRFPRYYIPLTVKGTIALKLKLHRGLLGILPTRLITPLLRVRSTLIRLVPKAFHRAEVPTPVSQSGAVTSPD
jgi:hypothetical protein